jgi:hypothetical protein
MILPTIHSGGTLQAKLYQDYYSALVALDKLITAWVEIEFHSRDYYVQGSPAWYTAVNERYEQTLALEKLTDYLSEIITYIDNHPPLTANKNV